MANFNIKAFRQLNLPVSYEKLGSFKEADWHKTKLKQLST